MESFIGTTWPVFLTITVAIVGFAAYMTGQAVANTWGPAWQVIVYTLLFGVVARFLIFALFEGDLVSLTGYFASTTVLLAIALFAYRLTKARKMVHQYPWLYDRAGLFGWRPRA